jgi:hypothetical protein
VARSRLRIVRLDYVAEGGCDGDCVLRSAISIDAFQPFWPATPEA